MAEKIERMRKHNLRGKDIIQPGAHPEYENPPKLGNPVTQMGGAIRKIRGTTKPENTPEWKARQKAIEQRQATVKAQRQRKRGA